MTNNLLIRYIALFVFVIFLTLAPGLIDNGVDLISFRALGVIVTLVFLVIDWRNYFIWKKEAGVNRFIGPVTAAVTLFYLLSVFWFGISGGPKKLSDTVKANRQAVVKVTDPVELLKRKNKVQAEDVLNKFKTLKQLREEDFISDYDYEKTKSELLKKY